MASSDSAKLVSTNDSKQNDSTLNGENASRSSSDSGSASSVKNISFGICSPGGSTWFHGQVRLDKIDDQCWLSDL